MFPCKMPEIFTRAFGVRMKHTWIYSKTSQNHEISPFLQSAREKSTIFFILLVLSGPNFVLKMQKLPFFTCANMSKKTFVGNLCPSLENFLVTPMSTSEISRVIKNRIKSIFIRHHSLNPESGTLSCWFCMIFACSCMIAFGKLMSAIFTFTCAVAATKLSADLTEYRGAC